MSNINLAKKLQPAKKAWKSFTKKLQSKLHKLNISISIKKISRGFKPLHFIRRLLSPRAITRQRSPLDSPHHQSHFLHHQHLQKNVPAGPAIYVDELFARGRYNPLHANIYKDEVKTCKARESGGTSCNGENSSEGKRVSSLPQWQGIDERAEEFISKFREDMMLQREKSILDFQDMLARSS